MRCRSPRCSNRFNDGHQIGISRLYDVSRRGPACRSVGGFTQIDVEMSFCRPRMLCGSMKAHCTHFQDFGSGGGACRFADDLSAGNCRLQIDRPDLRFEMKLKISLILPPTANFRYLPLWSRGIVKGFCAASGGDKYKAVSKKTDSICRRFGAKVGLAQGCSKDQEKGWS